MLGGIPPPRRRRSRTVILVIAIALAVIVLPGVGLTALGTAQQVLRRFMTNPQAGTNIIVNQLGQWEGKERITILVLGIDQRPNEDPSVTRTDMMLLLTLDPQTKSAGMMSIPRDLYVPMPDGRQDRINTAHVYGGPEFAMRTVEYNFGIPIQHYARVNFSAVTQLIDLLGGVEIYNAQEINDPEFPDANYGYDPFYLAAGSQQLNGATALKYARTRHGDSDFGRIRRQQQVMMALREKLVSTDAVAKLLPSTPQILRTLGDAIETDLGINEIGQLAVFMKDNVPKERIAQVAIDEQAVQTWTTPQGASVLIPIRDNVRELRKKFLSAPLDTAAAAATPEAIEPNTGRVSLQNGTKTVGLASGAKGYLEGKGYIIDSVSDATQVTAQTIVVDYHRRRAYVERLVATLGVPPAAIVDAYDPNSPVDVMVILGDDYQVK